jgi:phenylacetic acid degradation protein
MSVYSLDGMTPVIDPSSFVHPQASIIGDVIIGPRCYVGPGASLRGDFGRIIMHEGSNVQDCCVLHSFPSRDALLEQDSHIGHSAVLHGCTIRRGALIGIGSIVMDEVVVEEEAFVGAGSFVRAGFVVPRRTLVLGSPARVVRELTDQEVAWKARGTIEYQDLAARCLSGLKECQPLAAVEANRPRLSVSDAIPLHATRKGTT